MPILVAESVTPASGIQSALTTAFNSISTDLMTTITNVAPIALGIVGAGMVLVFGIKWFKRLTNKA